MQGDEPIEIDFPSLTKRTREAEPVPTEEEADDYGWLGALFADDADDAVPGPEPEADEAPRFVAPLVAPPTAPAVDVDPDPFQPPPRLPDPPGPLEEHRPGTAPLQESMSAAGAPGAPEAVDAVDPIVESVEPPLVAPVEAEPAPATVAKESSADDRDGVAGAVDPPGEESPAGSPPPPAHKTGRRRGLREELLATFSQLHHD